MQGGRPHWLDRLYVRLTPIGSFFSQGWGDPEVVERVVEALRRPPPPRTIEIDWGQERTTLGVRVRDGIFRSPVDDGSLPRESERGRVRLLLPISAPPGGEPPPVCVFLSATGEQGYERRSALAWPLVTRGMGALLLENPLYGQRRPAGQTGVNVRHVADLLTMGRAAVEEARSLLLWLQAQGHTSLGLSGYSMGGQMAALAAALVDFPVALGPVAAPHSARAVFLDGLLRRAPAWSALAGIEGVESARTRLTDVLEASSVTHQPPPHADGSAIILAAREDGYVAFDHAERIHAHWPGSEMRWIPGGHVSGYVTSVPQVRAALVDAFARLPVSGSRRPE
jgi:hypothetical protein